MTEKTHANVQSIRNLHFLIHPGFLLMPEHNPGDSIETLQAENGLLQKKYVNKAKTLGTDELVMLFPYSTTKELRRDVRNDAVYTRTIRKIKKILGKRLIVLGNDIGITSEGSEEVVAKGLSIAERRGFNISTEETNTYAWGETLTVCVFEGAENANVHGRFSKKTQVLPELTDEIIDCAENTKPYSRRACQRHLEYYQRYNEYTHIQI